MHTGHGLTEAVVPRERVQTPQRVSFSSGTFNTAAQTLLLLTYITLTPYIFSLIGSHCVHMRITLLAARLEIMFVFYPQCFYLCHSE